MPVTTPATAYHHRPVPEGVPIDAAWLRSELGDVERAIATGHLRTVRTATGAVTLTQGDRVVLADATSAAFAVTLPLARPMVGLTLDIKKVDSSGNAVTVTASGTNLIDGASTYALSVQYASVTVYSDGTGWWVL